MRARRLHTGMPGEDTIRAIQIQPEVCTIYADAHAIKAAIAYVPTWPGAPLPIVLLFGAQEPAGAQQPAATPVDADRWVEIDLYWFKQKSIPDSVRQFWERFEPLYRGVRGYRGVILNIGWTVGPVMEWSGDLDQKISLPAGSGQQKWVDERGPLPGTTEERKKKSEQRFAGALVATRHGYDPWTYRDVKTLASGDEARSRAARHRRR